MKSILKIDRIGLLVPVLLLCACSEAPKPKERVVVESVSEVQEVSIEALKAELSQIDTVAYLENYVEKVINEGSSGLGFASGDMQAGFADKSDAKMIAHYVVTLAGKECSDHELASKAQMYYTSNCGGCHGDDGKGLNGAFPDLTRPMLLGIEKRKAYLANELAKREK